MVKNFQANYTPSENLSIDESMIGFKGRLAFLQYMPKKPQKWGMKAWVLADAANGYVWNWKLYTRKEENIPTSDLGLAHRVVLDLLDDARLKNKGYRVFLDNFYSSPALLQDLLEEGFEACGTLRSNRKGIPEDVKTAKIRKGEKAKGSFTHFTAVLCLTSVTCSPVTADMTVWTTIWYRLRKWSCFQLEWKLRILCTTMDLSCLVLF